jgi:hypothetical protein
LNDIVNRLLGALKEPIELPMTDDAYMAQERVRAATTACTPAELDILRAVRSDDCDTITIRKKDGKVVGIDTEGDITKADLHARGTAVGVKNADPYETITIKSHGGNIQGRRRKPRPVSAKDNERVIFAAQVGSSRSGQSKKKK